MQTEEMAGSSYKPPDPRRQLSARVLGSIHDKIAFIQKAWRERAKSQGIDPDEISTAYVVEHLLATASDDEMSQWGIEWPISDEAAAKVLREIREDSKKQH